MLGRRSRDDRRTSVADAIRKPELRDEKLLTLAFAITIVCFGGAAAVIHSSMREIGAHSRAISEEALPWRGCCDALGAIRAQAAKYAIPEHGGSADAASLVKLEDRANAALDEVAAVPHQSVLAEAARIDDVRIGAARRAYALLGASALIASAFVVASMRGRRQHGRSVTRHIDELEAFAARVAHDVRSPLMPAMLAFEVAARDLESRHLPPDAPIRTAIALGERSLRTLERIVEGLLVFALSGAQPEAGAVVSVSDVLEALVAEASTVAAPSHIELSLHDDGGMRVACSEGVLASIVGNLLGNAIKFMGDSPERKIEVCASRAGARVCIEVTDPGPGLPCGAEARMFEPYVRGSSGSAGIGLGLATVKRLVTSYGGSIEYQRREPRGSIFRVYLPFATERSA